MIKIVGPEGLTKVYSPSVRAVDGISFSKIFTFLSPNGLGKTTTISMLTTVASITDGNATFPLVIRDYHCSDLIGWCTK